MEEYLTFEKYYFFKLQLRAFWILFKDKGSLKFDNFKDPTYQPSGFALYIL
jgi:hypothetical protein